MKSAGGTMRHFNSKSKLSVFGCLLLAISVGCSPVARTDSEPKAKEINSGASTNPQTQLTLPSWCSMTQLSDQVCFHCDREDGGVTLPYEQCLTPSDSFKATTDCFFSSDQTKTISCAGTRAGEAFVMDVSLAKEKLTAAVPAFLVALQLTVNQKYPDRKDLAALTSDLTTFVGGRVSQIIRGEDLDSVAGDLLLLVNKHAKTKLSDAQATLFKKSAIDAFGIFGSELSGRKDYQLSKFILRGLALSKSIPQDQLGDLGKYLTGPGLAELLAGNEAQSINRAFKILNPSVLGVKSVEDLLKELKDSKF